MNQAFFHSIIYYNLGVYFPLSTLCWFWFIFNFIFNKKGSWNPVRILQKKKKDCKCPRDNLKHIYEFCLDSLRQKPSVQNWHNRTKPLSSALFYNLAVLTKYFAMTVRLIRQLQNWKDLIFIQLGILAISVWQGMEGNEIL